MTDTRKTKIIATLGPASYDQKVLEKMIKTGMNVARLNFSHGAHEVHQKAVDAFRAAGKKVKMPVAIIQDLAGPKIRTGDLVRETVFLRKGTRIVLTTENCLGDETKLSISYKHFVEDIAVGALVLLDDGKKRLQVVSKNDKHSVTCKVLVGGEIRGKRGVNLPGTHIRLPSLTAKDKKDIPFAIKNKVDFIALSFVRRAADVRELKDLLAKKKADIGVIAKIETEGAIEHLDAIIAEVDGVMVARGDLAVEAPQEQVPLLQKRIIEKCNKAGKPVIVATQMLESMITSSVATRAEVNDVANSIFDGADAIMLSAESAIGSYPVEAIETMARVARATEKGFPHWELLARAGGIFTEESRGKASTSNAVTHAAVNTAHDVGAKVIVALTESGFTARAVSRFRPAQPVVVMSPNARALGRAILSFGSYPVSIGTFKYVGEALGRIRAELIKHKFAQKGDKFVLAAGVPFGKSGATNMVVVYEV